MCSYTPTPIVVCTGPVLTGTCRFKYRDRTESLIVWHKFWHKMKKSFVAGRNFLWTQNIWSALFGGHCVIVLRGTKKAQIPIYLPGGHCLVIPLSLRHR